MVLCKEQPPGKNPLGFEDASLSRGCLLDFASYAPQIIPYKSQPSVTTVPGVGNGYGRRTINSDIELRWNHGGRNVCSAGIQRGGNTTKSAIAVPGSSDGQVSTV